MEPHRCPVCVLGSILLVLGGEWWIKCRYHGSFIVDGCNDSRNVVLQPGSMPLSLVLTIVPAIEVIHNTGHSQCAAS